MVCMVVVSYYATSRHQKTVYQVVSVSPSTVQLQILFPGAGRPVQLSTTNPLATKPLRLHLTALPREVTPSSWATFLTTKRRTVTINALRASRSLFTLSAVRPWQCTALFYKYTPSLLEGLAPDSSPPVKLQNFVLSLHSMTDPLLFT